MTMLGQRSGILSSLRPLALLASGPNQPSGCRLLKRALDPDLRLVDDPLIAQDVAGVAEALEPVGQFLPRAVSFALGREPGVAILAEEAADLAQMAREAIGLQLQLPPDPALRLDRPDRQLDQRFRRQRRLIAHIEIVCAPHRRR